MNLLKVQRTARDTKTIFDHLPALLNPDVIDSIVQPLTHHI